MNRLNMLLAVGLLCAPVSSVFAADPTVQNGQQIKMDYTLTVNNEEIETSVGKEPLVFVVGERRVIPGLETAMMGMHVGEEKVVDVSAKDAYGDPDPKAVKEFPKASMPKDLELKPGMVLQAQAPDGESFPATIKELKGDQVVLDFNHPLAGKDLKFKIKILEIQPAPKAMPAAPAAK